MGKKGKKILSDELSYHNLLSFVEMNLGINQIVKINSAQHLKDVQSKEPFYFVSFILIQVSLLIIKSY